MSGDVSRVKQRKAVKGKGSAADASNGTKKMRVVETGSAGGASILTKLVFWSLLTSLGVTLTVVYVDYQPGQLKTAYTKYIPPEVRGPLDNGAQIFKQKLSEYYEIYQHTQKEGVKVARQWVKGVKIGDNDLEEILFADEMHEERMDKAKEAADKIKEAVEKINQKIAEEGLKPGKGPKKEVDPEEVAKKIKAEFDAQRAEMEKKEAEKAKLKLEAKKKAEAEAKRKSEEEAKKKAEEARMKAEAEAKKKVEEEAKKKAEAEAKRKAEEEANKKAEAESKRKVEEEAKKKAEAEAKRKSEEEAKKKAEAEAQRKAEEEAKRKAEAEAKRKAEEAKKKAEEARMKAEAEAKKKAEEEAKKKAEAEAQRKAEEEAKKKAEAEAQRKAEEEAKKKAEAEAKRKAEEEAKKKAEEARMKAEAEAKKKAEEEAKKKAEAEAQRKAEEEAKKKAEAEAQRKAEEEAKKKAEEARMKAEAEAKKKAEEEANRKAEEEAKKKVEAEAQKKAAEEARIKADLAAKQKAEAEAKLKAAKKPEEAAKSGKPSNTDPGLEDEKMLDRLEQDLETHPDRVIAECSSLKSPRAHLIKAKAQEALSKQKRSNPLLEEAINSFTRVLSMGGEVPQGLMEEAANRCVDLMLFRGWNMRALQVQKLLIQKFPAKPALSNRLGVLHLMSGQNNEAKKAFEAVLQTLPEDGFAMGHLGFILKMEATSGTNGSDQTALLDRSVGLLAKGIESGDPGVAKDGKFYFHLGDGLRRLGREPEADQVYKDGTEKGMFLSFWQRSLYNFSPLKAQPVWSLAETGIRSQLEHIATKWTEIRQEAVAAFKKGLYVSEGESLRDTGHWAQFELFRQGRPNKANCEKAPTTCQLVKAVPEISSNKRGQVKFSVMDAGTHVHAHSGPTNCRLRAHLGLKVPSDPTGLSTLRVADQQLTWEEGKLLVFDDSFDHEVWYDNPQREPRIVLIMDLWHPELTKAQRQSLSPI